MTSVKECVSEVVAINLNVYTIQIALLVSSAKVEGAAPRITKESVQINMNVSKIKCVCMVTVQ